MADFVFTSNDHFELGPAVDQNIRSAKDNKLYLKNWQDEFGTVFDSAHWLADQKWRSLDTLNGTMAETANVRTYDWSGWHTARYGKADDTPSVFEYGTWETYVNWGAVGNDAYQHANAGFRFGDGDWTNDIILFYVNTYYRTITNVVALIRINGVNLVVVMSSNYGNLKDFKLRATHRTNGTWFFEFDDLLGGGWQTLYDTAPDVYNELGSNFQIGLGCDHWKNTYCPMAHEYFRCTNTSYVWNDSPEDFIVDSVAAAHEYTMDAGAGKTLNIDEITGTEVTPSGTNFKYQWATDAGASRSGVSWNGSWLTLAQLSAGISGAGLNRYLFIKVQQNSDGTAGQELQDITITEAVTFTGQHAICKGIASGIMTGVGGAL